jgi:hypothetical protein
LLVFDVSPGDLPGSPELMNGLLNQIGQRNG